MLFESGYCPEKVAVIRCFSSMHDFCDPGKKLVPKPFCSEGGTTYLRICHINFLARDHTDQ